MKTSNLRTWQGVALLSLGLWIGVVVAGMRWPAALASVQPGEQPAPKPPPAPWLKGTTDEKLAQIEKQLRGLDQAMAEIGYRYGELLQAAKTRNWDYAQYQVEKIDHSLQLALERRPKRAQSAQPFLKEALPEVMQAIKEKQGKQLDSALVRLHNGCVQCHSAEKVLHFREAADRIRERAK